MYLYSNMVPSKREVQFFHRYMKLMQIASFYDEKSTYNYFPSVIPYRNQRVDTSDDAQYGRHQVSSLTLKNR